MPVFAGTSGAYLQANDIPRTLLYSDTAIIAVISLNYQPITRHSGAAIARFRSLIYM